MSDKTWKKRERQIAGFFGAVRAALSGGNGKVTRSDTMHPELFIEAKLRATHSAVTLWRKTADMAKKEGKIPAVALCEKNRRGFWVLCHSDDLESVATARAVARMDKTATRNKT